MKPRLSRYLPILEWGRAYNAVTFSNDLMAAAIVTVMLIPQSLAYALLAGLPPQVGLYASILPLLVYAVLGSSRTLAVGPVAVLSLMTAAAISRVTTDASGADALLAAVTLACLSGLILLIMGLFRLGFIANFLSHPVISGFITASGILIAASQLKHILGVDAEGHTLLEIIPSLFTHVSHANLPTMMIGLTSVVFLFWVRKGLQPVLEGIGIKPFLAAMLAKAGPVLAVITGIILVSAMGLEGKGVRVIGDIPMGMPPLSAPSLDPGLLKALLGPALLISLIGFVESVSVAQTLAAKRRQRIDPDQELIALGVSAMAAGASGGYPVTGGFSRSVVNFDAGAETPAAGAFTAVGILLATLFLTPVLYNLPKAILAATIIVAVLSLVDLPALVRTWRYCRKDFTAMAATILVTLSMGVELGVSVGVASSLFLHLYASSKPHFAIVGQVRGTEHFRNIDRHDVITSDDVLTLRVDESLYFANARFLEDMVYGLIAGRPNLKHLVLMCPAVNEIDASGLESLEAINHRLMELEIGFHLSEVKGPVMDRLKRSDFLEHLNGDVFIHQYAAMKALAPDTIKRAAFGAVVT